MKFRFFAILTALSAAALTAGAFAAGADALPPAQLQVTSVPEKARLELDGDVRGLAPQTFYFSERGAHAIRASLPGYVTEDRVVNVSNGETKRVDFALERERGLLLVTTEPAGAEVRDVRMNGTSLGVTPLLVTSLPTAAEHSLELVKAGYLPRRIKVNLKDRTPVAINERLMLDSGALVCLSEPEGVEVTVNGVVRGKTPLTLESIPKGSVKVRYSLGGYMDETRELKLNAGDRETLDIAMKGIPAKLSVVTVPEKATVYVDGEYQGKSPVAVTDLKPGEHTVKVELSGHAPASQTVHLSNGEEETATIALKSVLSRLEIVTVPAGVKLTLDGRVAGETKPSKDGSSGSEPFVLDRISAGNHTIGFKMYGYREDVQKVSLRSGEVEHLHKQMHKVWIKDVEIETITGTVSGVLVSEGPDEIEIELRPGVISRISRGRIRRITRMSGE